MGERTAGRASEGGAPRGERFDEYMERCLYGKSGFYTGDGSAGRRGGDFITSPEVGPLFGAVVAEAIDRWWHELGRPDPLTIYDVGCGPGTLLRAVAMARGGPTLDRPWRLIGVDRSALPGADAGSDPGGGQAMVPELPEDLSGAVVLANELLDNLPFRWVEAADDGVVEIHVVDGAPVRVPAEIDVEIPVGASAPIVDRAASWVRSVLAAGAARVCVFDYGAPTTAALAERGGWLRTYREHQRGDDPFREPGRWDITTDVPFDQLPAPTTLSTQADALRDWGIDRLVEEGRAHWQANAARPDLTAFRMRSRIGEAEALLDPYGLGGWWVARWEAAA